MSEIPKPPALEPGPAFWSDLQAHADRQALFLVEAKVSLLEAATAVADDDKVRVSNWIAEQTLRRPTADEDAHWRKHPKTTFQAVVVQPFVLAVPDA